MTTRSWDPYGRRQAESHLVGVGEREIPRRYDLAPSQDILIVRAGSQGRTLAPVRWGLVPSWAADAAIGNKMISARAETVAAKAAFQAAFKGRRCLIPASAFYEWQATGGKRKQPYFIRASDRTALAFAGLWERW